MDYGLPDKKKYPMPDKKHVLSAIRFFNYVDKEDEKTLANNINKKIKEYNMKDEVHVGDKNRFKNYFTESTSKKKLKPIFIVVSYTDTPFGKVISKFTGDIYSHAALSFDSILENMYSFNLSSSYGKHGGISFEKISDYVKYNAESTMSVLAVFVKEHDFFKIKANVDNYIANYNNTNYSIGNIFNIVINRAKDTKYNMNMICSQFVDSMFKLANINITDKSSNLVVPGDFYKVKNPKIFKVFEGKITDYNHDKIDNKINKLIRSNSNICIKEGTIITESTFNTLYENTARCIVEPIFEAKEFPIQFNDDGDLIIKNYKKLDVSKEYYNSCKLIRIYKRNNNTEALKYEASKLWFLRNVLQDRISANKDLKSNIPLQGKIVNTFSQTVVEINKIEKDFNFEEYYNASPFSDVDIRVDGKSIEHSIRLLKLILK